MDGVVVGMTVGKVEAGAVVGLVDGISVGAVTEGACVGGGCVVCRGVGVGQLAPDMLTFT